MTPEDHLAWLSTRRSIREFSSRDIDSAVLDRVLQAATTAPSASNRQPWRFAVVESSAMRMQVLELVKTNTQAIVELTADNRHAAEFHDYSDFFWQALASAKVIIIPQYRTFPDQVARMIDNDGVASSLSLPSGMQPELCGTSAAVMALLLQAHAEGLGATWMAGPTVAKSEIETLLTIQPPWKMLGAVALGYPAIKPVAPKQRKDLKYSIQRF